MKITFFLVALAVALSGCGKTPEFQPSVDAGKKPKQIIDKVTSDVTKAMQKDAEQRQEAEKKE